MSQEDTTRRIVDMLHEFFGVNKLPVEEAVHAMMVYCALTLVASNISYKAYQQYMKDQSENFKNLWEH